VKIIDYRTAGGKNLIIEYIDALPEAQRAAAYKIRHMIEDSGGQALYDLDTRQLKGKLWEIKFSDNRIMYIVRDSENIYFLHACKKQKNKAQKHVLDKAVSRAKKLGLKI
jgi:phage-related protein